MTTTKPNQFDDKFQPDFTATDPYRTYLSAVPDEANHSENAAGAVLLFGFATPYALAGDLAVFAKRVADAAVVGVLAGAAGMLGVAGLDTSAAFLTAGKRRGQRDDHLAVKERNSWAMMRSFFLD